MLSHDELKQKLLENPKVKVEYDALHDEFALFAEIIKARRLSNLDNDLATTIIDTAKSENKTINQLLNDLLCNYLAMQAKQEGLLKEMLCKKF